MDIEKLIERLQKAAADGSWNTLADLAHKAADALQYLSDGAEEVNASLREQLAENEKLRAELEQTRKDCAVAEKNHADCIDELERVKRERDAVLNAFRGFIQLGHLCEYCAETLKDDPACSACEKWSKFQWRGVGEED